MTERRPSWASEFFVVKKVNVITLLLKNNNKQECDISQQHNVINSKPVTNKPFLLEYSEKLDAVISRRY